MLSWQLSTLLVLVSLSCRTAQGAAAAADIILVDNGLVEYARNSQDKADLGELTATFESKFGQVLGRVAMTHPVEVDSPKGEQRWTFSIIISGVTSSVSGTFNLAGQEFPVPVTQVQFDKLQYQVVFAKTGAKVVSSSFELLEHLTEDVQLVSFSGIAKQDFLDKTIPWAADGDEIISKSVERYFRERLRYALLDYMHPLNTKVYDQLLLSIS
ncbi:hypothetical protein HDE_01605 [Halotydeus destructor]|nr:hypothetical protein HDE_01605 [Halotydeus destructor]